MVAEGEKKPNRGLLNFIWWFGMVLVIWGLVALSPLGVSSEGYELLITLLACLIIQATLYWLVLRRIYPEERRRNLKTVIFMCLLILFGVWFFWIIFSSIQAGQQMD